MPVRPSLPDEYDLPDAVNGWHYAPDDRRNARTWTSEAGTESVCVYAIAGQVYATVEDNRVDGHEAEEEIVTVGIPDDKEKALVVAAVVDEAVAWMEAYDPDVWNHELVCEAVFDPPVGYEIEYYALSSRETSVYYHRPDTQDPTWEDGGPDKENPSIDEFPYLVIDMWNGSGNSTVSLAPCPRAHDHQLVEVVETPDECGLEKALALAWEYVEEQLPTIEPDDSPTDDIGHS